MAIFSLNICYGEVFLMCKDSIEFWSFCIPLLIFIDRLYRHHFPIYMSEIFLVWVCQLKFCGKQGELKWMLAVYLSPMIINLLEKIPSNYDINDLSFDNDIVEYNSGNLTTNFGYIFHLFFRNQKCWELTYMLT